MEDEDKNKTDNPKEVEEPKLSIVDEARKIRDEIIEQKKELREENDRRAKLQSEELLGSNAGGRVEHTLKSPEDLKKEGAKEFFKDSALEGAIDEANEKK